MTVQARADVVTCVRSIIQRRLRSDIVLSDESPLYSAGLLDSMSIVDLLLELEASFRVSIPGAEIQPDDLDSISKITATVQRFIRQ